VFKYLQDGEDWKDTFSGEEPKGPRGGKSDFGALPLTTITLEDLARPTPEAAPSSPPLPGDAQSLGENPSRLPPTLTTGIG
jgi:hypothetical protein